MRTRTSIWIALISASPVLGGVKPSFMGLGFLEGNNTFSGAGSVSPDGSTVVGFSSWGNNFQRAFLWTQSGGMQNLGNLPGFQGQSFANDVSNSGEVVVGIADSYAPYMERAFRWTAETGMTDLGVLPDMPQASRAWSVSADGRVVVGMSGPTDNADVPVQAFRWTEEEGMIGLGDLPGGRFASAAYGTSFDGSVVVGWSRDASGVTAFRWTVETGMVPLYSTTPDFKTHAAARTSADGSMIYGYGIMNDEYQPFIWRQETGVVPLIFPEFPNGTTLISGINETGSVMVGMVRYNHGGFNGAFIWDAEHGPRSLKDVLETDYGLDLTGWSLDVVTSLSADGTVLVGEGMSPNSRLEAWRAVIPEPSGATLALALTILLLNHIQLRRR